ncbi:hypothetical protein [Bacillus sp. UMB0728]|uniref:hypothetical protein n=1 Tax=Bacillus sp. UMB0728 TaxID=2066052 RepID=UPI000C78BCAA|nr:hypothetical protein [Bacillus sp. UMB0728]PLR72281.1 hypothetical protein CYJ37_12045 [Bacillus sp. UMB0728]
MLSKKDVQKLAELENKMYHLIMDNVFENGLEVAKKEYESFLAYLENESYSKWVITHLKKKNDCAIKLLAN